MTQPFISICIPAYKRTDFLERLLNSIKEQIYRDFEVIISDDSPGDEVQKLCKTYAGFFPLKYYKNPQALGTPKNWNEAISNAEGEWIKLMHDDDWFSNPASLQIYADTAKSHNDKFIFAAYNNVFLDENKIRFVKPGFYRLRLLRKDPYSLLSKNIIGPPSVTLYRNFHNQRYDNNIKWLVDIEFYIRELRGKDFFYISEPLINVGMSREQVTVSCHRIPEVEIPEYYYFLKKNGTANLRNIWVYDAWWRLFRNFKIYNKAALEPYVSAEWPDVILKMLDDLSHVKNSVTGSRLLSKYFMYRSFMKNKR